MKVKGVKKNNVERELDWLKKTMGDYKIVVPKIRAKLEKRGYTVLYLGYGKQSIAYGGVIDTWQLKNSFLTGTYIGLGIYGKGVRQKYTLYRALVKKVI